MECFHCVVSCPFLSARHERSALSTIIIVYVCVNLDLTKGGGSLNPIFCQHQEFVYNISPTPPLDLTRGVIESTSDSNSTACTESSSDIPCHFDAAFLWRPVSCSGLIPQLVQDEPGGKVYDMRDFKWRRYNCYFEEGFESALSDE